LYIRTRDIEDKVGTCLRIGIAPHPAGAMVTLERRDRMDRPAAVLSLYGTEILGAFLMAARLSAPFPMPDETVAGPFSTRFRLDCGPPVRVMIEQDEGLPLPIEELLWDRLYAELCLVTAHGRELARQVGGSLH